MQGHHVKLGQRTSGLGSSMVCGRWLKLKVVHKLSYLNTIIANLKIRHSQCGFTVPIHRKYIGQLEGVCNPQVATGLDAPSSTLFV